MKTYKKNLLQIDGHLVTDVIKKYPTPIYIYSQKTISDQFMSFYNAALDNHIINPLVCFALKANNNIHLLKALAKLGSGADIVSIGEMRQALKAKIPANKIVFSGVGKTSAEISEALKAGIYSFNVESIEEIFEINEIAKSLKKQARISLRLNPQVLAKTHKHISTGHKTHKFGILKEDIKKEFKKITTLSNIQVVGISIHIGSQLTCLKATKKAIKEVCKLALDLNNYPFEFFDVGGGLGVDYEKKENTPSANEYMKIVSSTIEQNYYKKSKNRPHIVFEPGRFISASCGNFITKVLRTKKSSDCLFAIIDGGMNDFVRSSLYGAYHEIIPIKKSAGQKIITDIVGPICETTDCFATKRPIQKIVKDDLLCVEDVGAYGYTMSSTYNMRQRVREIVINEDGKILE